MYYTIGYIICDLINISFKHGHHNNEQYTDLIYSTIYR